MSIYAKGLKGKADRIFSQYIRTNGECERCGSTANLQCAHIVRRRYNATRTLETNAWCLCARCHFLTEEDPLQFMELVSWTIGVDTYRRLKAQAEAGIKANDGFWEAEIERLTDLLAGVDA